MKSEGQAKVKHSKTEAPKFQDKAKANQRRSQRLTIYVHVKPEYPVEDQMHKNA